MDFYSLFCFKYYNGNNFHFMKLTFLHKRYTWQMSSSVKG